MKMTRSSFGRYLAMLRTKYGITQIILAEEMGCVPSNLSRVAMGGAPAPRHWVATLTTALNNLGVPVKKSEIKTMLEYSNGRIPLDEMDQRHGIVLAAYANNDLSEESHRELADLLDRIGQEVGDFYNDDWACGKAPMTEEAWTR